MAHPVASQPTMNRVIFRTRAVSRKRLIVLQAVFPLGTRQFLHRDQAVLHDLESDLILNFFDLENRVWSCSRR